MLTFPSRLRRAARAGERRLRQAARSDRDRPRRQLLQAPGAAARSLRPTFALTDDGARLRHRRLRERPRRVLRPQQPEALRQARRSTRRPTTGQHRRAPALPRPRAAADRRRQGLAGERRAARGGRRRLHARSPSTPRARSSPRSRGSAQPPVYVTRTLDPEMIRLGSRARLLQRPRPLDRDQLDDRRALRPALRLRPHRALATSARPARATSSSTAARPTTSIPSRSTSKRCIADILADATGGALGYFSLLRPYSEARIARLFARETQFDHVFSSCNRNFKLRRPRRPALVRRMPEVPLRLPDLRAR